MINKCYRLYKGSRESDAIDDLSFDERETDTYKQFKQSEKEKEHQIALLKDRSTFLDLRMTDGTDLTYQISDRKTSLFRKTKVSEEQSSNQNGYGAFSPGTDS